MISKISSITSLRKLFLSCIKGIKDDDPKKYLHEQIIKGDRSDGIPNILSDDNVFVTGEKQQPIHKKRLQEAYYEVHTLGADPKKVPYYKQNLLNSENNSSNKYGAVITVGPPS